MKTIAVIDDDISIGDLLEELLLKQSYAVIRAYSGSEALLLLKRWHPDLILTDLLLPGITAKEVSERIQGIPIIALNAKTSAKVKAAARMGNVVDYLAKPFDSKQLLAKVSAHLPLSSSSAPTLLSHGALTINPVTRQVFLSGKPIRLTPTEYAILKVLMQNPDQVIAKPQILSRIHTVAPDCMENSLQVHISHLRKKLRSCDGTNYIDSVWGMGFKMSDLE